MVKQQNHDLQRVEVKMFIGRCLGLTAHTIKNTGCTETCPATFFVVAVKIFVIIVACSFEAVRSVQYRSLVQKPVIVLLLFSLVGYKYISTTEDCRITVNGGHQCTVYSE